MLVYGHLKRLEKTNFSLVGTTTQWASQLDKLNTQLPERIPIYHQATLRFPLFVLVVALPVQEHPMALLINFPGVAEG
jgi:hypothetical protein